MKWNGDGKTCLGKGIHSNQTYVSGFTASPCHFYRAIAQLVEQEKVSFDKNSCSNFFWILNPRVVGSNPTGPVFSTYS